MQNTREKIFLTELAKGSFGGKTQSKIKERKAVCGHSTVGCNLLTVVDVLTSGFVYNLSDRLTISAGTMILLLKRNNGNNYKNDPLIMLYARLHVLPHESIMHYSNSVHIV